MNVRYLHDDLQVMTAPADRIDIAALGATSLRIGMGCASLGSRISERAGKVALAAAFEAGITWFDVAPPYGIGRGETILGSFARGRRDRMLICTKVGLAPPQRRAALARVYDLARPAATAAKGLRRRFRQISATRNLTLPLTPELVLASLDRSLGALGTDYVDVLALHDAIPADTRRADILGALHDARAAGKLRAISVAGSLAACETALKVPSPFQLVQFAAPPGDAAALALFDAIRGSAITPLSHSVLGLGAAADRFAERLAANPDLRALVEGFGFNGRPNEIAVPLLLRRALAVNRRGLVLLSMFSRGHLEAALAALHAPPLPARLLDAIDSLPVREEEVSE